MKKKVKKGSLGERLRLVFDELDFVRNKVVQASLEALSYC